MKSPTPHSPKIILYMLINSRGKLLPQPPFWRFDLYFLLIRIHYVNNTLFYTLLYFTLLYFTLLYFTLLDFTLLYFTLPYCTWDKRALCGQLSDSVCESVSYRARVDV